MTNISQVTISLPDGALTNATIAGNANIEHTKLAQRVMQSEPIPLAACRTWDNMALNLPAAASLDDLGLLTGTPGTNAITISAGDLKATTTTRKLAFELTVPDNYDDGQTFEVQILAGMKTTLSDGTATVDLEAYKPNGAGGVGADLCNTAALSINSLTPASKAFVITSTSIDPGDTLLCVLSVAVSDTATATAVDPTIYSITRSCDTRG